MVFPKGSRLVLRNNLERVRRIIVLESDSRFLVSNSRTRDQARVSLVLTPI